MNAREWKPGDVAMVTYRLGQCTERNLCAKTDKGWDCLAPGVGFLMHGDVVEAHPLVVLDPEDRAQVERLIRACPDDWAFTVDEETVAECTDHMQTALREFANPKPVEPTGIGAVVEDAEGNRWVRAFALRLAWTDTLFSEDCREYADIDAVRVLSEGVTQ